MGTDLERVDIPYRDEDGLCADFHAKRHTFISNPSKAGTSPKMVQTLARHSDINLTMNTCIHIKVHDRVAAVGDLLPPPVLFLKFERGSQI